MHGSDRGRRGDSRHISKQGRTMSSGPSLGGRSFVTTVLAGATVAAFFGTVEAQETGASTNVEELVVTGSRIRRTDTETPAPVTVIDQQALADRGFVQVGQALNEATAINRS